MSTKSPEQSEKTRVMRVLQLLLPILVIGSVAGYMLMQVAKVSGDGGPMQTYNYEAFGSIPVSEDGRVKPLDTVARNSLLQISGKQSLIDEMLLEGEEDGRPAIVWLAEVMTSDPDSRERRVFRIDDPDVLGLFGKTVEDGNYYSLNDVLPALQQIEEQARKANEIDSDDRTRFEEHVIGLRQKIGRFFELQSGLSPYVVAPTNDEEDWAPFSQTDPNRVGRPEPTVAARTRPTGLSWAEVVSEYMRENPEKFNQKIEAHIELVREAEPKPTAKASFEQGYNAYRPFAMGIVFYTLAGVVGLLGLLFKPFMSAGWYRSVWRTGTGILIVTLLLHTAALIVRMWLQGRPPVTNLYSSAVFIGWAVVLFAVVMELISKLHIAALSSSIVGVATLFIAHNLAKDGDTMGVMQAVLDSNFWLGTHVITITLGYAATFFAGFLAILYVLLGMCTPLLDKKSARLLAGMVYGVTCFALLFSFVGTVLGGIWADQSWGRFWGWDPKENGAIMIVLINAVLLHARWGHLVKDRGIMAIAILGNVITAWSWFGTNLLGVGLHSYGFMDGAMVKLATFVAGQLMIIGVAMAIPTSAWVSFVRPATLKAAGPDQQLWGVPKAFWLRGGLLSLAATVMLLPSLWLGIGLFKFSPELTLIALGVGIPCIFLIFLATSVPGLLFRAGYIGKESTSPATS